MKFLILLATVVLCAGTAAVTLRAANASDEQAVLQADRAAFGTGPGTWSGMLNAALLSPNFTWTDSSGNTRSKSQVLAELKSGKKLLMEIGGRAGEGNVAPYTIQAHAYAQLGVVQANSGDVYILRIWIRQTSGWQLLLYQSVKTGAPPSNDSNSSECNNPCLTVPFQPRNADERAVIHAYQDVERAVAAHDSAAWAKRIADDFFAVTSNSNRPLDKRTRMAGLDNQKVGGIAQFPLVSARMFEFGDTMVMTSLQKPVRGLPIHVTRVWFKRNGNWLEGYSYQTTIQPIS